MEDILLYRAIFWVIRPRASADRSDAQGKIGVSLAYSLKSHHPSFQLPETKYTVTPLNHYYGLLGLMLHEEELGLRFDLKDVRCAIDNIAGHGTFIAASPDFAIALIFPGWYIGDTWATPVLIGVKGDLPALFAWLPLPPADKRNIIKNLTIGNEAQVLTLLSV